MALRHPYLPFRISFPTLVLAPWTQVLCRWRSRIWKILFGPDRGDGGRDIRSNQAQLGQARVSWRSPSFSDSYGRRAWDIGYNGGLVAEFTRAALQR